MNLVTAKAKHITWNFSYILKMAYRALSTVRDVLISNEKDCRQAFGTGRYLLMILGALVHVPDKVDSLILKMRNTGRS